MMPTVSFVIPVKNAGRTLDACLRSIVSQDYPHYEIVIVDNISSDNSIEIARKYTDKIYSTPGPLGKVRQLGFEKSSGQIIAIFDADYILPTNDWLKKAIRLFVDDSISTVWPYNICPPDASSFTKCYFEASWLFLLHRYRSKKGITGGLGLVTRKSLEAVNGFDETSHWSSDFDLASKLAARGYNVVFFEEPIIHDTRNSFADYVKKEFLGARSFSSTSLGITGLTTWNLLHEHIVLGGKEMFKKIFHGKLYWSWYVPMVVARLCIYGIVFLKRRQ